MYKSLLYQPRSFFHGLTLSFTWVQNCICLSFVVPPSFQKLWEIGNMLDTGRRGEAKDVIINNPISLYCETNAAPAPTLTWYKDGHPLTSSEGVLILPGKDCQEQGAHLNLHQMCFFSFTEVKWSGSHSVVSDFLGPHGLEQSMAFSRPEYWSG